MLTQETEILPKIEKSILDRETAIVRQQFRVAAMVHKHKIEEGKILAISGNPNFDPYFKFFFPRGEKNDYAIPNPARFSDLYSDLQNPSKKFGERILGDMLTDAIADGGAGSHVEELILRRILELYGRQSDSN